MFQKKEIKNLFQTVILSRTDFRLIIYIKDGNGMEPFKVIDENTKYKFYTFFLYFPDDDYAKNCVNNNNDDDDEYNMSQFTTMKEVYTDEKNFDFTPSLRHLLQSADPLPQFIDDCFPENLDVDEVLKRFLVSRGDVSSISSRLKYYSKIFKNLNEKSEEEKIQILMEKLPKTLLELTDEIEILTLASFVDLRNQSITNFVLYFTYNQLIVINKIIAFDKAKIFGRIATKSKLEYIENDHILEELFKLNVKKIFERRETRLEENIVVLLKMIEKKKGTIFSKNHLLFDELKNYCIKKKSDVVKFDMQFGQFMEQHFDEIIDYLISNQFCEKKNNKNKDSKNQNTKENTATNNSNNNNYDDENNNENTSNNNNNENTKINNNENANININNANTNNNNNNDENNNENVNNNNNENDNINNNNDDENNNENTSNNNNDVKISLNEIRNTTTSSSFF